MHLTDEVLAPIRARYGEPALLEWGGEISEREYGVATFNPVRTHDVTLFIVQAAGSIAGRATGARPEDRDAFGVPGDEWLRVALGALVDHARRFGRKRLAVERFDGEPVAESEVLPLLVDAGFLAGPRRAVLRP